METRNSIRPFGPVVIDIENITKDYVMGEEVVRALRGVTLQICRNEYIAIMGPSGSGKSTLMNMLGCLDTPSSGRYEFNGKNVAEMDDDELIAAGRRRIQTTEHVHQRRFTTPAWADDGDVFVAANLQGHAAQRTHDFLAHHVVFSDVLDVDHDRPKRSD